ncbi:aldehyde dehydrogenase family protein [Actinomadura sp. KC06]|nr:aldehyde dehydrogenase family protein [Actinomadura sp. KC06]
MKVYTDEIFGPVLSMVRVRSYDEAMTLINASPYGNGACVFTRDGGAARRFQNEVEAGMVGVNVPVPVPMAYYSFGGWKNSLFGDTHAHGTEGVHFFTRGKVVTSPWPEPARTARLTGFPGERPLPMRGWSRGPAAPPRPAGSAYNSSALFMLRVAAASAPPSRGRALRRGSRPRRSTGRTPWPSAPGAPTRRAPHR